MPFCAASAHGALSRTIWLIAGILLLGGSSKAVPVGLRVVEASAEALDEHALQAALDGELSGTNGWQLKEGNFEQQFAVFATEKPISAAMFQVQFFFLEKDTSSHFENFGVSITTDESPSLRGRWIPLLPESASANGTNVVKVTGRTLRVVSGHGAVIITLRAEASFTGITGFRLRIRPRTSEDNSKTPQAIGSAPDGHFRLTEMKVEAEPLKTSNIALGRQVYGSGTVPANLPKHNLTDGLSATYSRPEATGVARKYYFTVDLGRMLPLDHIVVRGRADGEDSDRLGKYRLEVLASTSENRRKAQWQAVMHADDSRLPIGGADVIQAANGEGILAGDGVRIWSESEDPLQPQVAELEVYPALQPVIRDWQADGSLLEIGGKALVPAHARKVGFNITCSDSGFASMVAAYRWRIPGWYEQWQEVSSQARVELRPPTAGTYELQVEALHTDGIWDQSGLPVAFTVALPWWREPARIAIIAGAAILLGAAAWWRISAWQANGRLMIAERHLELNRERLRIARDMHDEIGARLTYIALLADRTVREGNGNGRAEHSLGTLADSARSAVNALDDIVWVVTPQHDTVGSLVDYLTDYAPSYLQAAGIDCNLNMQVTKPQRPLSLTARQGLLMAVKEALQNVAKHSKARSVRLSFTDQAARLEIEVLDDGVGLKTSNAASSNGLVNMRQRLAEIGGSCEIAPASDNGGVSVRFTLALDFAPAPEKL